jgi:adenosylhomocysteine nucleosidase
MTRTVIIAAMPGELKPLVRSWQHEKRNGIHLWRWSYPDGEWIAACGGAGVNAATRAFAEAEKEGTVSSVISVGWVGALDSDHLTGHVYRVSGVIDARTGERFPIETATIPCWLVTNPRVADGAEKQRLAATYDAALVDMEAAAIGRLAAMRGIPFQCVRGVSDGLTDRLPDFNHFIAPNGQFQLARFTLFALSRPWHWPGLIRMGENSRKAALGIAASLLDLLDERGHIRQLNGYPNFKS